MQIFIYFKNRHPIENIVLKKMKKITLLPLVFLMVIITKSCNKSNQENKAAVEEEIIEENLPLIFDGESLKLVSNDFIFAEGPAVDTKGNVFFTDQPNDRIMKWDAQTNGISVYMQPAGRSNGLFFDKDGNLLACADKKFELWKIDKYKNVTVLLDNFENKNFNGPNDMWLDAKGGIYFTDPYYQRPYWERKESEMDMANVYYLSPDYSKVLIVASGLEKPNGIIGAPDGKTLYVSDNGAKETFSFQINDDASLSNKTLFVEVGSDGMTIDNLGNVYLTNSKGVTAYNKFGIEVLNIPTGQSWTANVTFGGPEQNILFITAMTSVYTLKMNVKGVR